MFKIHLIRFCRQLRNNKQLSLSLILGFIIFCLLGNAACFYLFDGYQKGDNLSDAFSFGDALWASIITITTIGYGDFYAQSMGARIGMVFFIIIFGMSMFTVFLGMMIDWTTDMILKGKYGMGMALASHHVLIINFPSEARVKRLINELKSDLTRGQKEVVIISDKIDKLPFDMPDVLFIHGSPLEEETYKRARIDSAALALVLATSYDDVNSDAVVASTVSVIENLRHDIHTVAECLDDKHRLLFKSVQCDSIIQSLKITDHMLVQEVFDPGVAQMIDVITSNTKGSTLFSTEVAAPLPQKCYNEIAKALRDKDINVISVNRGTESHTSLKEIHPQENDRLIYIAASRLSWEALMKQADV